MSVLPVGGFWGVFVFVLLYFVGIFFKAYVHLMRDSLVKSRWNHL